MIDEPSPHPAAPFVSPEGVPAGGREEVGNRNFDSYDSMLAAVRAFHEKHDFKGRGGEEMTYRLALMIEELGEIAECVTKGRDKQALVEEVADLYILLLGTAIAAGLDLKQAFWEKMAKLESRTGRMINGRIRVSEFKNKE